MSRKCNGMKYLLRLIYIFAKNMSMSTLNIRIYFKYSRNAIRSLIICIDANILHLNKHNDTLWRFLTQCMYFTLCNDSWWRAITRIVRPACVVTLHQHNTIFSNYSTIVWLTPPTITTPKAVLKLTEITFPHKLPFISKVLQA